VLFRVEGSEFQGTEIIPKTTKNETYLKTILDRKAGDTFPLPFDLNDPRKEIQ
jgi:hypothetical protein